MGYSALIVKRGSPRHKKLGRIYVYAMSAVVVTAYMMAILKPNAFLFGIAIFTTYFIYTGWSSVGGRWKTYAKQDRLAAYGFFLTATACLAILGYVKISKAEFADTFFTTALIFSIIAIAISLQDIWRLKGEPLTRTERIVKHLISMCAGLIATTTAVMVTLISYIPIIPPIFAWIGSSVVISPLIFYWVRQMRASTP